MKKIILLLFVFSTLLSCTSKNEAEVELINGLVFKLIDGEKVKSIDSETKEKYHSYINNTSIQIPLFRCIESDNYVIYIGFPISATIKKLVGLKIEHINNPIFFDTDSTSSLYVSHYDELNYITEYFKIVDNNTLFILIVSNSLELSDSLFNIETLSARLKKK